MGGVLQRQAGRRSTRRKRQIRAILENDFAGRPVLLDELRWAVRFADGDNPDGSGLRITRSWLNSFARTIREQFPDYRFHKIPLNDETPIGLVARTAVYRLTDSEKLRQFLKGSAPSILCRYTTNMQVDEPRYQVSKYVTPHYYAATFRFFADGPREVSYSDIEQVPGTFIPLTHKLSLLAPPGLEVDLKPLTAIPWKLFGYDDLNVWYEVDAIAGLSNVKRNQKL